MNERIDELFEEALVEVAERDKFKHLKYKFANLIIKECCGVLSNMHDQAAGRHNYYKCAAVVLKEHFGIE